MGTVLKVPEMKRWFFFAATLTGIALWQSVAYGVRMRTECRRLAANQAALMGRLEHYRVRDSLSAAGVEVLTLRAGELRRHCASLSALVHDMGIKLRRLESVAQVAVQSDYAFETPARDTVVMQAGPVPAQALRYDNGHMRLDGIVAGGMFHGTVLSRDTLTQVVHRIPRRLLFLRWGTRELRQEIVSSNPHTQVTYSRYIKVVK